jgi:hypothetical protein
MTKTDPEIPSIRKLAKLLGCDEKTLRSYLVDERWPFRRKPRWKVSEVPAMQAWRAQNLEQQPDGDGIDADPAITGLSPERKAKIRLVIERTAKVRLERELLAGRYLLRDAVQSDLVRRASEAKRTLESVVNLTPRLIGKDESEVRRLLAEHVTLVCEIIAGGQS